MELGRMAVSAVARNTELEVSGVAAGGIGTEIEVSRPLQERQVKAQADIVAGLGFGLFGGAETNVMRWTLSNSADSPFNLKSGAVDFRAGFGFAIGGKLEINTGGQLDLNIFYGLGLGGKAIATPPVTLGIEETFNE